MSGKSLRTLIGFVVLVALGMWYFQDMRSPAEREGRISVSPDN